MAAGGTTASLTSTRGASREVVIYSVTRGRCVWMWCIQHSTGRCCDTTRPPSGMLDKPSGHSSRGWLAVCACAVPPLPSARKYWRDGHHKLRLSSSLHYSDTRPFHRGYHQASHHGDIWPAACPSPGAPANSGCWVMGWPI